MKDTVHSSRSVPLTIGALYLIAAFVQIWYWWGYLIVPHNDFLLSLVRMLVSGRFGDMVMGAIGLFYQTLFAWCVLSVLWIGLRIIRLSLDPGVTVRIMSWHAKPLLKAFASLCVVLICALMGFTFQSVSPMTDLFMAELMIGLMASYSLFAAMSYRGHL